MAMGVLFCFVLFFFCFVLKMVPPPNLAFINSFIIALRSLQ